MTSWSHARRRRRDAEARRQRLAKRGRLRGRSRGDAFGHPPDAIAGFGADCASGPFGGSDIGGACPKRRDRDDGFHERATGAPRRFRDVRLTLGLHGEDGYEISLASTQAESFARLLLSQPGVAPIGLGARDSLRLEAGLCLYGHELDETVDPIEAVLVWSIQKRRRLDGGFPGATRIQKALANGADRQRVGVRPDGRAPAREGAEIVSGDGAPIGVITSGGFGPSVNGPIAMGYVARAHAAVGTPVSLMVRGKPLSARVVTLPFHPHAYYRG